MVKAANGDSGDYSRWLKLPEWVKTNRFFKKDLVNGGPMHEVNPEHANLVSSQVFYDGQGDQTYHYPILDIDLPVEVLNSTTPGHHHLFIKKLLTDKQYDKLLRVLVEVGIVQQGIIDLQWEQDKMTCARMPGIKKEFNSMSSGGVVEPSGGLVSGGLVSKSTISFDAMTSAVLPKDKVNELMSKVKSDKSTMIQLPKYEESVLTLEEKKNFELLNKLNAAHLNAIEKVARIASEGGQEFETVFKAFLELVDKYEKDSKPEPESPF